MPEFWIAVGTVLAAMVAMFTLLHAMYAKPNRDKFTIIFTKIAEHDKVIATVPAMAEDIKDVKTVIHELTNRFSELAQGVARIEGKLGAEEK